MTLCNWMVVDDHPLMLRGVAALLRQLDPGCQLHKATTISDAVRAPFQPARVVLDLSLPDACGVESILAIRRSFPAAQVCAISGFDNPYLARRAADAGATGYISKASLDLATLSQWCSQGRYFPPGALSCPSMPCLTERETDVLRALERGASTKEIANDLAISPRTIDRHVESLLDKFGASNRLEVVARARAYAFLI